MTVLVLDGDSIQEAERLARFIMSTSQVRGDGSLKPNAFMPPSDRNLSVTRHGALPIPDLWGRGRAVALQCDRNLHGRADVLAGAARNEAELQVVAAPLPSNPEHAHITAWPSEKPAQMMKAQILASHARFEAAPATASEAPVATTSKETLANHRVQQPNLLTRFARWGDRLLLRRLPEFHLFASEADRVRAIAELDREVNRTRAFARLVAWVVVIGIILANLSLWFVPAISPWGFDGQGWMAASIVAFACTAIIIWGWRRSVVRHIRAKLIEMGVPVCRQCGYEMRGLVEARCPECGWEADEQVKALIQGK